MMSKLIPPFACVFLEHARERTRKTDVYHCIKNVFGSMIFMNEI